MSSQVNLDSDRLSQDRLTRGVKISNGFDRLKIGFYVEFAKDYLFDVLQDAKTEAQESRSVVPVKLGPDENYFYNCHATGKQGGYSYHISKGDINIFVSTRKNYLDTPNVFVDIGSASCWTPGYATVLNYIDKMIRLYTGKVIKNSITEVHLCADFIGLNLNEITGLSCRDYWITRANKFNWYQEHSQFSGISLHQDEGKLFSTKEERLNWRAKNYEGLQHLERYQEIPDLVETGIAIGKGDIALRVYDKVLEIKKNKSKQSIFSSVWGNEEYDSKDVTRVEFQLRKNVLREFLVKTLEDLKIHTETLWRYCTGNWTRFCEKPFDKKNRHHDRALMHTWWLMVQNVSWGQNQVYISRRKILSQKNKKQLVDQMIGCALNVATIGGCKSDDTEMIIAFLQGEIDRWCHKKATKIDKKSGKNELQLKMEEKFNEVWPYGYREVHGPTLEDSENGFISSTFN